MGAEELARFRALLPACRARLETCAPELQDEVDALGNQVLLGVSDGVRSGGAASVFLRARWC